MENQTQLINRRKFNEMKKYNIQQMNQFYAKLYHDAFQAGVRADKNSDFRITLYPILEHTKGIGPVLTKRLMAAAKDI